MGLSHAEIHDRLRKKFPNVAIETPEVHGEPYAIVPAGHLTAVCTFLRDDPELQMNYPSCQCGTDDRTNLWSVYHLYRDISTDILGIHNRFVDFAHRQYPGVRWCASYCKYTTFPPEIFNIVAIYTVLKRDRAGLLGVAVLLSLPLWLFVYLNGGQGPIFGMGG